MTVRAAPAITWGETGLVPVVVQDAADGRVLMLAYADREAVDATIATGELHFHSRSRDRLWRKGETSGNVLRLVDLAADCDGDALLATVEPAGPTCHRGSRSCFDAVDAAAEPATETGEPGPQGFAWLEQLWSTIDTRARERPAGSYTASLLDGGVDGVARKVAEESTEVILAAKDDASAEATGQARLATRAAVAAEAADLAYHLLVLLAERGIEPRDAIDQLRARHRQAASG